MFRTTSLIASHKYFHIFLHKCFVLNKTKTAVVKYLIIPQLIPVHQNITFQSSGYLSAQAAIRCQYLVWCNEMTLLNTNGVLMFIGRKEHAQMPFLHYWLWYIPFVPDT